MSTTLLLLLLSPFLFTVIFKNEVAAEEEPKGYIVHMSKHEMPLEFDHHFNWYDTSLKSISSSAIPLYKYDTLIHGYSAHLTSQEAKALELLPGVLAVVPDTIYQLHTTRTPDFLHLPKSPYFSSSTSSSPLSNTIIAVLDTGIWPESKSFSDSGIPSIPSSWKGECQVGTRFTTSMCNNKLIGARYFYKGYVASTGPINITMESLSCRDDVGHGTHTASTAAGAAVSGANLYGYANGTARGIAVNARIASYKVCWLQGCFAMDIMAAMEAAVNDGVNVISMSLGGFSTDFYKDSIAIGAFAAMEKGIFVSCSAGNNGPLSSTVSNAVPWITTVGASSIDRAFPAVIALGNGVTITGGSLSDVNSSFFTTPLPIFYAGKANVNGSLCFVNSLDSNLVKGKIVFCDRGVNGRIEKGVVVKKAGGVAMILGNTAENKEQVETDLHFLPTSAIGEKSASIVKNYINSEKNPTGKIMFKGTVLGVKPSPVVASFSSRGPNSITSAIIKPDLVAPGVNILAAWAGATSPSGLPYDSRRVEYNIISGTSMACPHVSGLAAILKSVHPDWTPAAIRSALMTTSYTENEGPILDDTSKPATPFDMGSGHVDPVAALNPGLVYDITGDEYFRFLCALKYDAKSMEIVTKRKVGCVDSVSYSVGDLNYPSFGVEFESGGGGREVVYKRNVRSVGGAGVYKVKVSSEMKDVKIDVVPLVLKFSKVGEVKEYVVTFRSGDLPSGSRGFGKIVWDDGVHSVKSPVAFTWV